MTECLRLRIYQTLLSKATYSCVCVPWELNPRLFALLTQCSTTEPQEHFYHIHTYALVFIFKDDHSITKAHVLINTTMFICIVLNLIQDNLGFNHTQFNLRIVKELNGAHKPFLELFNMCLNSSSSLSVKCFRDVLVWLGGLC